MAKQTYFAVILLETKDVQRVSEADDRGATFSDLFTNAIFRDIVILLSATIDLYVVASVIHIRGVFGMMDGHWLPPPISWTLGTWCPRPSSTPSSHRHTSIF